MLQQSGGHSLAASSSLYSRAIDRKARMSPALTMFPDACKEEQKDHVMYTFNNERKSRSGQSTAQHGSVNSSSRKTGRTRAQRETWR